MSKGPRKEEVELQSKVVVVKRVTAVTKGGRKFSFSTLTVVGDGKGHVGFGVGKANEVPDSKDKADNQAKKVLVKVNLRENRTIHHDVIGKFGASTVILRTAPAGTGIIAGGPVRTVLNLLGVHDVVGKAIGSTNPYNIVRATFDALSRLSAPKAVAEKRSKKVSEIVQNRESGESN